MFLQFITMGVFVIFCNFFVILCVFSIFLEWVSALAVFSDPDIMGFPQNLTQQVLNLSHSENFRASKELRDFLIKSSYIISIQNC
jgi:hypothetical protein